MRAALLEDIEKITVREIPEPEYKKGAILLKVKAAALCGSDIRAFTKGRQGLNLPQVLGHEVIGRVIRAEDTPENIKEGDILAIVPSNPCGECDICRAGFPPDLCPSHAPLGFSYAGGFAEYMLIPPHSVKVGAYVKVPPGMDLDLATLAEPLGCVIHGQNLVRIGKKDTVAVIGAGPVGCMHLVVAGRRGASNRILIQRSRKRLEFARQLKLADTYICILEEDPVKRVREATQGRGADVVIVSASSKQAQELSMNIAGVRGRINFFGGLPKDNPFIKFNSNLVHYKELTVTGSAGTGRKEVREALDFIKENPEKVEPLITHKFPLEKINEAIEVIRKGEGVKVLIKPG